MDKPTRNRWQAHDRETLMTFRKAVLDGKGIGYACGNGEGGFRTTTAYPGGPNYPTLELLDDAIALIDARVG